MDSVKQQYPGKTTCNNAKCCIQKIGEYRKKIVKKIDAKYCKIIVDDINKVYLEYMYTKEGTDKNIKVS